MTVERPALRLIKSSSSSSPLVPADKDRVIALGGRLADWFDNTVLARLTFAVRDQPGSEMAHEYSVLSLDTLRLRLLERDSFVFATQHQRKALDTLMASPFGTSQHQLEGVEMAESLDVAALERALPTLLDVAAFPAAQRVGIMSEVVSGFTAFAQAYDQPELADGLMAKLPKVDCDPTLMAFLGKTIETVRHESRWMELPLAMGTYTLAEMGSRLDAILKAMDDARQLRYDIGSRAQKLSFDPRMTPEHVEQLARFMPIAGSAASRQADAGLGISPVLR